MTIAVLLERGTFSKLRTNTRIGHHELLSSNFYKSPWFAIATFTISSVLVVYGISRFVICSKLKISKNPNIGTWLLIMLMCVGLIIRIFVATSLPNSLLVFGVMYGLPFSANLLILFCTGGMKSTGMLILRYPQVVLISSFTPLIFHHQYNLNFQDDLIEGGRNSFEHTKDIETYDNLLSLGLDGNDLNKQGFCVWNRGTFINAVHQIIETCVLSAISYKFLGELSTIISVCSLLLIYALFTWNHLGSKFRSFSHLEPQIFDVHEKGK